MGKFSLSVLYDVLKNLWGVFEHPYLTWKRILRERDWVATLLLLLLTFLYFGIRDPIQWGSWRLNGLVLEHLTVSKFKTLIEVSSWRWMVAMVSYVFVVSLFSFVVKLLRPIALWREVWKKIFVVWIYSYVPTLLWFLITAGLFALLPPPRGNTFLGMVFTFVYLTICFGLFLWKGVLFVLTLKLAGRLTMKQIFKASMIVAPAMLLYSELMYLWGVFRVPFV